METALAIVLWAVSFVFVKLALGQVSPSTLITLRFAVGALVLGGVAALRGEFRRMQRLDVGRMAVLGAVGITLQQMLQVSGQVSANASVAAFLASTAPAFTVALAALLLRESLRGWQILGVLLATLGAGVVSGGGDWIALRTLHLLNGGDFLILLSAVVWAAFSILNRYLGRKRPAALMTAGMMAFGCLFTLPWFVAVKGWQQLDSLRPVTWGALFYIGFISTAMAYLLYTHALKHAEASRLAAIQNIEPLVAMLAAALMLGESVTGTLLVGGAAIVCGVYLAERGAKQL